VNFFLFKDSVLLLLKLSRALQVNPRHLLLLAQPCGWVKAVIKLAIYVEKMKFAEPRSHCSHSEWLEQLKIVVRQVVLKQEATTYCIDAEDLLDPR